MTGERAIEYFIDDLDVKVHYLLGFLCISLIAGPILIFGVLQSYLASSLRVCSIFFILFCALVAFFLGLAGASYVKVREEGLIEIRSRNLLLTSIVVLVYGIVVFSYYMVISEIVFGQGGWETLLFPIALNLLALPLTFIIFQKRIRIDQNYLHFRAFREEKTIKLEDIFHVSPPLKDLTGMKPLTIYSRTGIVQLDNFSHSPIAKNLIRELLLQKLGDDIFNPSFDFRSLDKETRQLIENEKVTEGGRGLRATAWSNEGVVVISATFFSIFVWIAGVSMVYHLLRGNTTGFIISLGIFIGFGSVFFWSLYVMVRFRHFDYKILKSSPGVSPKRILEDILRGEGLSCELLPRNKIPAPYRFQCIWRINDDFLLRFKQFKKGARRTLWLSIGPIDKMNESTVNRVKALIDNSFLSID